MMAALSRPAERSPAAEPLVEISGLTKLYPMDSGWLGKKRSWLSALEDVDLSVRRGEILALVGESGSGKSTLARLLIKLIEPTRGEIATKARTSSRSLDRRFGGSGERCRSCSRIRTRRSTHVTPCTRSSAKASAA